MITKYLVMRKKAGNLLIFHFPMCYGDVPTIHSNINLKLAFENQEYDLLILNDVSRENSVSKYGHSKGVCDLLFCCTWKYTDEWAELWKPWIMENILEWYLWYSPYLLELIDSREILGTGTKSDLLTWQRFRELFLFGNFNPWRICRSVRGIDRMRHTYKL